MMQIRVRHVTGEERPTLPSARNVLGLASVSNKSAVRLMKHKFIGRARRAAPKLHAKAFKLDDREDRSLIGAQMVQRLIGRDAISAKQLEREIGVPQTTLSRWLGSRSSISSSAAAIRQCR